MYVNAFWVGVFVTLFVEIVVFLGLVLWTTWRKIKNG